MAAPYNPPKKGEDFSIDICLTDADNPNRFKVNPTIAAGDFKVYKDNGAPANLTTLPSVSPAGSMLVTVSLSATEMNADKVTIVAKDQSDPPEWADFAISIPTTT